MDLTEKITENKTPAERLESVAAQIAGECIECGLCRKDCSFLQQHGMPKAIAEEVLAGGDPGLSFRCSLCGLCRALCPQKLDPAALFAAMRELSAAKGRGEFRQHRGLLAYERWGASPLFSWYGLPEGCDTVFFPGCSLAGSRAGRVVQLYDFLRQAIPSLGMVLDCCTKPSHDLGRREYFLRMFGSLRQGLAERGIREVLVACPSCYRVWRDYGGGMKVRTVYQEMCRQKPPHQASFPEILTVHDSCPTRENPEIHQSVRELAGSMGFLLEEMRHQGSKTLCCGEGGAVCHLAPETGGNWTGLRAHEAGGRGIITYCAGCTHFLGRLRPAFHLLDLFFAPDKTLAGSSKTVAGPVIWLHRLLLKRRLSRLARPMLRGRRGRGGRLVWRRTGQDGR